MCISYSSVLFCQLIASEVYIAAKKAVMNELCTISKWKFYIDLLSLA